MGLLFTRFLFLWAFGCLLALSAPTEAADLPPESLTDQLSYQLGPAFLLSKPQNGAPARWDLPPPRETHRRLRVRVDGNRVVARIHQVFFNASYQNLEVTLLAPDPGSNGTLGLQVRSPTLVEPPRPALLDKEAAQAMARHYALAGGNPSALTRPPGPAYSFGPFPVARGEYIKVDWRFEIQLSSPQGGLKVLSIAPGARPPRPLALNAVELDFPAAFAANTFSPTHRLLERPGGAGRLLLNPVLEHAPPSQPLLLLWPPKPHLPGVVRGQNPDGENLHLVLVPPTKRLEKEKVRAQPRCWVVALDVGGSIRGRPFQEAIHRVEAILKSLGPKDFFDLVPFSAFPQPFRRLPLPATKENVRLALDFLKRREPRGAVNFEAALLTALEVADQGLESMERAVLLLTDGRPTLGEVRAKNILEQRPESPVPIFPVASGVDTDYFFLEQLARLSGGRAIFHEPEEDPLRLIQARVRPAQSANTQGLSTIRIDGKPLPASPELRHSGAQVATFAADLTAKVKIADGPDISIQNVPDAGLIPFLVDRSRILGRKIWGSIQGLNPFPGGAHSFHLLGIIPGTPRSRILHTIRYGVGPLGRARMFALQGLLDHGIYQPVAPGPNRAWSGNRYFQKNSDGIWIESGLTLKKARRVLYGSKEHETLLLNPQISSHLGLDRQVALFSAPGESVLVAPQEKAKP